MKKIILIIFLSIWTGFPALAQSGFPLVTKAYIDAYYATDNDPTSNNERKFSIVNAEKDQFSVNTIQISSVLEEENFRVALTLHTGIISKIGWQATSTPLIQEANAGVKLYDNLWMDAGYFLCHLGSEPILPKSNWLSCQSLISFFGPSYQSGVKIGYKPIKGANTELYVLNGAGIHEDNNKNKSLGWVCSYSFDSTISLSYNGMAGNELPSEEKFALRQFHDFILLWHPFEPLSTAMQFDVVTQNNLTPLISGFFSWRYTLSKQFFLSGRGEFFSDKGKIFSYIKNSFGITLGLEFHSTENSFLRLESRYLNANNAEENSPERKFRRIESILAFGLWI